MREERGDPVRLYGGQRDAIHAGRAALGAHQGPGVTQEVGPEDLVLAEGEPAGGRRLGLAGPASAGGPARALEVRASRQSSRELPVGSAVNVRPLPSAEVMLSSTCQRYYEPLRLPARPPAVSAWALSARVGLLSSTGPALPWCPVTLSPPVTPATPEGPVWPGRCSGQSGTGLPPPLPGSAPSDIIYRGYGWVRCALQPAGLRPSLPGGLVRALSASGYPLHLPQATWATLPIPRAGLSPASLTVSTAFERTHNGANHPIRRRQAVEGDRQWLEHRGNGLPLSKRPIGSIWDLQPSRQQGATSL
jgi:hypothetical protein